MLSHPNALLPCTDISINRYVYCPWTDTHVTCIYIVHNYSYLFYNRLSLTELERLTKLAICSIWSQSSATWLFAHVCVCVCVCVPVSVGVSAFACVRTCACMNRGQWEWWVCKRVTVSRLYIVPSSSPRLSRGSVEIPTQLFWSDLHREQTLLSWSWQIKESHKTAFKEALCFPAQLSNGIQGFQGHRSCRIEKPRGQRQSRSQSRNW